MIRIGPFVSLVLAFLFSCTVHASNINFDDQGLTGPSLFSAASPIPQTLNITVDGITVTLNGGVILTNTTALPVNTSSIYGTASFVSGMSNPLTLSFSTPVDNIVFDVLNGLTTLQDFLVTDNIGNSQSFSLAPNLSSGAITLGLVANDISSVTILQGSTTASTWDFFVDNISFNVNVVCTTQNCRETSVPEPDTIALLSLGFASLALIRRRKEIVSSI